MYKLVAVDLDGTMLNSYGIVTENTKNVIKKVIERGTEVIIASGRPIDSIKTIAKEIGSNNYFIAGNGALIYDIKNDKTIYEKYMTKQKVLEIIKICEENSISYNVYTDKTILATSLKSKLQTHPKLLFCISSAILVPLVTTHGHPLARASKTVIGMPSYLDVRIMILFS